MFHDARGGPYRNGNATTRHARSVNMKRLSIGVCSLSLLLGFTSTARADLVCIDRLVGSDLMESRAALRGRVADRDRTPELVRSLNLGEDVGERLAAESRSKVTFDIEPLGDVCKLTVVHDGFDDGSTAAAMVSLGWPRILSDLKTLLETGETMPRVAEGPIAERLRLGGRQ